MTNWKTLNNKWKCDKDQLDDKKDKNSWISCFRCAAWCCYACVPDEFKRASATVYYCENYIKLMELLNELNFNLKSIFKKY